MWASHNLNGSSETGLFFKLKFNFNQPKETRQENKPRMLNDEIMNGMTWLEKCSSYVFIRWENLVRMLQELGSSDLVCVFIFSDSLAWTRVVVFAFGWIEHWRTNKDSKLSFSLCKDCNCFIFCNSLLEEICPGSQSLFHFIPKVLDGIEVRDLWRPGGKTFL